MTDLCGAIVVFRADASLQIGAGHVMRCLTLAAALAARGARCRFVCRPHTGHLIEQIARQGFDVTALAPAPPTNGALPGAAAQAACLGCDPDVDAKQTLAAIGDARPEWLVVDHYGIDAAWEARVQPLVARLMVIDDLANRPHSCDLLLDQNLGRQADSYAAWVAPGCRVLAGPRFALLRPEFAALRAYSLQRRKQIALNRLLIALGGGDQADATARVLVGLRECELPASCRLSVVLGAAAPGVQRVQELAAQMPWPTEVLAGVDDMAQRMADADLAVGAAGGSAWERCSLGLPTALIVLADNQRPGALALESAGAAVLLGDADSAAQSLPAAMARLADRLELGRLAAAAGRIADGRGSDRVVAQMMAPDV
jgi:UDP-2,4-diacetamido-2,4,6-trideoxy-beta-L-altropyranose hydrolase